MRILNGTNKEALNKVVVYLTFSEASELRDKAASILETPSHHEHISSEDYQKELTICIYDKQTLESFDERSRMLIENDA